MPRSICFLAIGVFLLGCPGPKKMSPPAASNVSEADRPALRIQFTGSVELADAIARRWKSISDQPLELRSVDSDKLLAMKSLKADILVVESRCLPTLVERHWISKLPKRLSESHASEVSNNGEPAQWPLVWRQSATYGQRLWGIPLGVPMLAIVENADGKSKSPSSWTERVTAHQAEKPEANTPEKNISDSFILDRFLVIAASLNPTPSDSGFLFNINSARSRLSEPWLIKAATVFGELYSDQPSMAHSPPDATWELVAKKSNDWALAWPASQSTSALTVFPLNTWVDSGHGLVASLTTMNRQSSASIRFLIWLNEDAQREEFSSYSVSIQPVPDRWASVGERTDINRYREIMKRAFDDRFVVHELRFAESFPYRQSLIEALNRILQEPTSAEVALQECSLEWDKTTASISREIQKQRLALTFDLEAYRD